MSIEALEARILETGEDEDYAVLGDLLEQRGDPRGKLIALQRGDRVAEVRAYLDEHRDLAAPNNVDVQWYKGYWDAIAIRHDDTDLAAVLAHPSARVLRVIQFDHPTSVRKLTATLERSPGPIVDGPILDALGHIVRFDRDGAAWLPALGELERLRLGVRTLMIDSSWISESGADIGRLRGLTELHLRAAPEFPSPITHEAFRALAPLAGSLVTLSVQNCRYFDDEIFAMLASFEHLEHLHLRTTLVSERALSLLPPRVRVTR
jgi:hypothetical protein